MYRQKSLLSTYKQLTFDSTGVIAGRTLVWFHARVESLVTSKIRACFKGSFAVLYHAVEWCVSWLNKVLF